MPRHPPQRWTIRVSGAVRDWLRAIRRDEPETYRSVNAAIDILAETGPGLGRPLVDTLRDTKIANLKELRPRSGRDVAIRIIFIFDPWSQAVLLIAGNKARQWSRWYEEAIPVAEEIYADWLIHEEHRRRSTK